MKKFLCSSLSSSDYSKLPELVNFLIDVCEKKKINISLPSLRIDAFSLDVMKNRREEKQSDICSGSRFPAYARCY